MQTNPKHLATLIPAIFLSVLFLHSCKIQSGTIENYDRAALIKNLADSVIVQSYSNFAIAASNLEASANAFVATPDLTSLNNLRSAWKNSISKWMHCEMVTFGYANSNFLNAQIAANHANFKVIEDEIHGTNPIDKTYIASTGATRKGLPAIEYLLFGDSISPQSILDGFTTSPNSERRKQYLVGLCGDIIRNINAALEDWSGKTSYTTFLSQTQFDVNGSLNLLLNDLVGHIETVRKTKVGRPLGFDNKGITDGSLCEYRLAPHSIENIRENILAWKDVFTGKNGPGFDDYLDHVGAQINEVPLSTAIIEEMDLCLDKAYRITMPLHIAIVRQSPQVFALHTELNRLIVLIKVDLPAKLGLIVTFNDNDGD